jgi:nucleoside-diphosphate-sugar epimerase
MTNKKILVLGGTQMLGRHFVSTIDDKYDHQLMLANRKKTDPTFFEKQTIVIDRDDIDDCCILVRHNFDIIVDFSCYNITQLTNILSNIKKCDTYIMISTQSVLDLQSINNPIDSEYKNYCVNKRKIEEYLINSTHPNIENVVILRPCAVYGDRDYTNRFIKKTDGFYWRHSNCSVKNDPNCVSVEKVTDTIISIVNTNSKDKQPPITCLNISN